MCIKALPPRAREALGSFASSQEDFYLPTRQVKQLTPTHDSWARYHDGITSALLGQDRLKEMDHWAGSYGNAHPQHQTGKLSLARKPWHRPQPPCAAFLISPCTAVAASFCAHEQLVLPQQLGQSISFRGFPPALVQDLTTQLNHKFL